MFWRSCVFDGFLVFSFVFLKSIMPVFLAQLLSKLQTPNAMDSITSTENNGTSPLPTSSTTFNATVSTIISYANDNDDNDSAWQIILGYMVFIW